MSEMGWVRDNFVDVIEYANGPSDSRWGAMRAEAGHDAPFDLRQVEIGNENQGREYAERYEFIQTALASRSIPTWSTLPTSRGRARIDARREVRHRRSALLQLASLVRQPLP